MYISIIFYLPEPTIKGSAAVPNTAPPKIAAVRPSTDPAVTPASIFRNKKKACAPKKNKKLDMQFKNDNKKKGECLCGWV
jgi:hypothetical protein